MSATAPAIALAGVSRRFLVERRRATGRRGRWPRRRTVGEELWALCDVTLQVPEGQTLGLLGANGSGKSTLLGLVAGVLPPTGGQVRVRGRVGSLLELGANALLAVSQAVTGALAEQAGQPLHRWLNERIGVPARLPVPHFNVINGGAHAANQLRFQEFMVAPTGAPSIAEAVRCGAEVYAALRELIEARFRSAGVGDEGGFAPDITTPEQALDLLVEAIEQAGYRPGGEVQLALDPAANGFLAGDAYHLGDGIADTGELIDRYQRLPATYPIRSIEDGLAETDRAGWRMLTAAVGEWVQVVGDDLLVTNPQRIRVAAKEQLATAALVKPNQVGTVTETLEALAAAREVGWGAMVSHRSGETTDTFIADLAVAAGVGQLKTGAPARGERVAKYNRLLEIEATSGRGLRYGLAY